MLQSILFDKHLFTLPDAHYWLYKHHIKPIKAVHITENYYRFRINKPVSRYRYYAIKPEDGVVMIHQTN